MKTTIDMAREAGWTNYDSQDERFKAFEALVRADEREETNRRANASWTLMCEKMVAAEREACAKDFEAEADTWTAWPQAGAAKRKGAAAIRARGKA